MLIGFSAAVANDENSCSHFRIDIHVFFAGIVFLIQTSDNEGKNFAGTEHGYRIISV